MITELGQRRSRARRCWSNSRPTSGHPHRRARRQKRRRRRRLRHQHHQLHHRHRSRYLVTPRPDVGGKSSHGGYCGPAVKPIALHMVSRSRAIPAPTPHLRHRRHLRLARRRRVHSPRLPALVQVCTAAMHYGFRIVEDMIDGLSQLDGRKRLRRPSTTSAAAACPRHRVEAPRSQLQNRRAHQRIPASAASSATPPAGTARTSASTSLDRRHVPAHAARQRHHHDAHPQVDPSRPTDTLSRACPKSTKRMRGLQSLRAGLSR
jgi:hypothetical protein